MVHASFRTQIMTLLITDCQRPSLRLSPAVKWNWVKQIFMSKEGRQSPTYEASPPTLVSHVQSFMSNTQVQLVLHADSTKHLNEDVPDYGPKLPLSAQKVCIEDHTAPIGRLVTIFLSKSMNIG